MWAFILGLAVALDLGDAHGHNKHRHRHHHGARAQPAALLTAGRESRDPVLHLEPRKAEEKPRHHMSRHLRRLLGSHRSHEEHAEEHRAREEEHRAPEERAAAPRAAPAEEKATAPAAPAKAAAPRSDIGAPRAAAPAEAPIVRPAVAPAAQGAVETVAQPAAEEAEAPAGRGPGALRPATPAPEVTDDAADNYSEDDLDADLDNEDDDKPATPAAAKKSSEPAAKPAAPSAAPAKKSSKPAVKAAAPPAAPAKKSSKPAVKAAAPPAAPAKKTSEPAVKAAAPSPAATSKTEPNGTANAAPKAAPAAATAQEVQDELLRAADARAVRDAVEGDEAPLLDDASGPTDAVTPATAAPEAPAPAKIEVTNVSLSPMGGLDRDYDKEDLPYQRIQDVLQKFPLLAASPLWNLVNPSALTAHDPPVIDMSLADLRDLMTPDGQGLADAFPQLHLRDLPLFEWMPNKTLPKEWLNPVDAELPEFLDFLPESVGRMSLQDIRLRDLLAVAEQKRAVWSQHWADSQKNLNSADLAAEVEHLEARLKKATAEHDDAISQIQALDTEHKSLVAAMDMLQKKFNADQDLITNQEEEHLAGDQVRAALGKKVEEMDQGRKDLELKIATKSSQLKTLKEQAAAMKKTADSKQREMDEILAGKKAAEKALRAAKSDLAKDANLATELKEVKKDDAQLKMELNATLADEAAEAKANAALNAEVATLVAENRRLATVHLATLD